MAEIIEAAHRSGFTTWAFTPHAPISIESPCNMSDDDVSLYMAEVERLRRLYPDMQILAGMEVDYLSADEGPASQRIADYGLDLVIGSVHFIPNQQGVFYDIDGSPERFRRNLDTVFGGDLGYVVRTFWQQTADMIAAGGFDIIGHIDKIARNASTVDSNIEQTDTYRRLADRVIDMAIASGKAIEINTKQYESANRFFPHPRYWQRISRAGIMMPVNSDTHEASRVNSGRPEALRLLSESI